MIVQSGCFVNEYGWEGSVSVPQPSSYTTETMLQVAFDHDAHRLFSSVRISVCCGPTAQDLLDIYRLVPQSPLPSITPVFSPSDRPSPPSLPVFNAIFDIERIPTESDLSNVLSNSRARGCYGPIPFGQLTLKEDIQECRQILFEVNQPLTTDTRNVSFSFTHSLHLYTPEHGTGRPLDGSFNVGRIVRVQPAVLPFNHQTILFPTEILLMIFENISDSSQVYRWWRRDLLSCALVCKQWTCALGLLLNDFRYSGTRGYRNAYPPEIRRFANALALHPSLGLSITHLSPDYFFAHPSWKDFARLYNLCPSGQSLSHTSHKRLEQFVAGFSSILRHAKNLRSLSLSWVWSRDLPEGLLDALQQLDKLEEFNMQGSNTPYQTYPYLAMWPTLKRLTMGSSIDRRTVPIPTSPPAFVLTEVTLGMVGDDHLNYILSSSSSSLERLTVYDAFLTNRGLHTALQGVAKSLVSLRINYRASMRDECEERAMDALILDMVRLKSLYIDRDLATHQMIKRRAEVFQKSHMSGSRAVLPVVELMIDQSHHVPCPRDSLVVAAASAWPGWEIKISEPCWDPE